MTSSPQPENCCCHNRPIQTVQKTAKTLPSLLLSILIAFFPKCPVCWAVYMSMFGSLGLAKLPYMSWLLPVLMAFLGFHLFLLYRKTTQRGYLPFGISLLGALFIIGGRFFLPAEHWLLFTGMALIVSGSLLNSLSLLRFRFINHH